MTTSQKVSTFIAVLLSALLIQLLKPILMPFLVGALLAYLGDPLVERFVRVRVPRVLAVVLVFILFFSVFLLALLFLVPVLERQLLQFIEKLPLMFAWLRDVAVPWLSQKLGIEDNLLAHTDWRENLSQHWQQAGGAATWVLANVSRSSRAFIGWGASLVLIPVVVFYLMRDWHVVLKRMQNLLPRAAVSKVTEIVNECDEVLGALLRGQLSVMLCLGFIYAFGLWIVGLEMSLLIGLLAGLLSIVPYLGFIVGILVASLVALFQFHAFGALLGVWAVFAIGQALESMLLTPLLVGDRIGLHPVAVVFAVMAGGQLFGFVGILLALPVAALLMVFLRHLHQHYVNSDFYAASVVQGDSEE